MSSLWFEPSERVSTPAPAQSWTGIAISLLGHTILISALVWAGKQWVPITPPETIEVMLMELPAEQAGTAEVNPTSPPPQTAPKLLPQTQPPAKEPLQKAQTNLPPLKAKTEPVKPLPTPEQIADINTAEKALPPPVKSTATATAQTPTDPTRQQSVPAELPKEVSPARVDARYASTNPRPQYPSMARRLGQEGTVVLEVIVSTEGLAKSVRVQESSGHELLDQAALQAISRWKFVPAKRGEVPIEQKLSTRWTYKLEE